MIVDKSGSCCDGTSRSSSGGSSGSSNSSSGVAAVVLVVVIIIVVVVVVVVVVAVLGVIIIVLVITPIVILVIKFDGCIVDKYILSDNNVYYDDDSISGGLGSPNSNLTGSASEGKTTVLFSGAQSPVCSIACYHDGGSMNNDSRKSTYNASSPTKKVLASTLQIS